MTFSRPDFLPLAPLAALLFTLALGWHWHRLRRLAASYDAPVLRRLLPAGSGRFPTARLLGLVASGAAIGLAAAGLEWGDADDEDPRAPLDIAIVVDLSLSMSATDVAPSRVVRAREVIARLTEELPSVRFSLVSFAGWPLTLLPPTDDPTIVRYFAQSLGVELVQPPDRGSSLADALWLARSTLEERPRPEARQTVLLLTDGDVADGEEALAEAAAQASDGLEIWAAGVGTETGVSLFVDGAPLLDQGAPVIARLDETLLRSLADTGQGRYENVSGESGLESLVANLSELSGDDRDSGVPPVDAAFLLVLLAVPLLLWEGAADAGRTVRRRGRTEP